MSSFGLVHILLLILVWCVTAAVVLFALYWTVRLAVLHALKAHSQWQRGADPGPRPPLA